MVLFSGLLLGAVYLTFGSVPAATAYFRGERVSISPRLVDLGSFEAGEVREVTVEVCNWTDEPIRLIGGTADCSCTVLGSLPLDIPAREWRSATVSMRMPAKAGIFTRRAGFVINDNGMKRIDFPLTGRIVEREPGGSP